jgi:hypothetical protein
MRFSLLAAILVGSFVGCFGSAVCAIEILPNPRPTWPSSVYAPYVDMTLWPPTKLGDVYTASGGLKYFTLAFVTGDSFVPSSQSATWGGYTSYPAVGTSPDVNYPDQTYDTIKGINDIRAAGGDVMLSLGGANANPDLAARITNVSALSNEYNRLITEFKLRAIDFDIEGTWVADAASIDRRSKAIALTQAAHPEVKVWLTLPTLPTGLDANGLAVLNNTLNNGVRIDGINVMTMDYGDSAAPNPDGSVISNAPIDPDDKMGDYAIQAANGLYSQLQAAYLARGITLTPQQLWSKVGITPMIGRNDVETEIVNLQEAAEILAFAQQHQLGYLGMWSLTRDKAGTTRSVAYDHSGLLAADYPNPANTQYAFATLFNQFNAVPEPGTIYGITAMAGAGLYWLRRKKRAASVG